MIPEIKWNNFRQRLIPFHIPHTISDLLTGLNLLRGWQIA
jgi:hypothetical protein